MRWYQMPILIFVLAFALGGSFALTYFKPFDNSGTVRSAQKCYDAEYTQDSKFDDRETFWEKSRCDPTAYFTLWLAGFTLVLAVSTIGLWIATQSILREAADTSQKELRAYVGVESVTITDPLGAGIKIQIVFRNYGNTPASNVYANTECDLFSEAKRKAFVVETKPDKSYPINPTSAFNQQSFLTKLTHDQITALRRGEGELCIWGNMSYVDCFGGKRETGIRAVMSGPISAHTIMVLQDGNEAT